MTDQFDVTETSPRTRAIAQSVGGGGRRWAVLATITLLSVVSVYNQLAISILAPEITTELGISNAQFAGLLTAPMLSGVLLAIPAGGLADRFGVKRVVAIAFAASLLGLVLRIFADTYAVYFVAMFLLGWANIIAAANSARLLRAWYGTKHVGIAVGVFLAAGPIGSTAAQLTVPYFAPAQSFYWFGAALLFVVFVLWLLVVRNAPTGGATRAARGADPIAPVFESVKSAIRNPHVFFVGLGAALFGGAQFTVSGFLPVALNTDRGLDLAQAGAMAALYTAGTFAGNLISPVIAARLGRTKPVIIGSAVVGAVFIWASWALAGTPLFVVAIVLAGAGLGGAIPLIISAPALLPSVAPNHVGGAGGVVGTVEALGVFVLPIFVIASVAGTDYGLLFTLAGVSAALIAVVIAFVPEFGRASSAAAAKAVAEEVAS
jgi:NNP family nitrate/nitrite transporter-like MFS transporter